MRAQRSKAQGTNEDCTRVRVAAALLGWIVLCATSSAHESVKQRHVRVRGLKASAEIIIDRWGVPHIYAKSADDAFLAQGWNAARDRLWQIDTWRRSGLGELSEVLGPDYVAQDRAVRLFIYRGSREKEWTAYGPDAKRRTEAFVAGINAYVSAVKSKAIPAPIEFTIAGYMPAKWLLKTLLGFAITA